MRLVMPIIAEEENLQIARAKCGSRVQPSKQPERRQYHDANESAPSMPELLHCGDRLDGTTCLARYEEQRSDQLPSYFVVK